MVSKEFGLKEEWEAVEKALMEVIPVYDKTNHYISFGTDLKIRSAGLDLLRRALEAKSNPILLDLGAGPGRMTQLLGTPSIMVDALPQMLKVAKMRNPGSERVLAVFENLPFRERSIDGAFSGFAVRDARNLGSALSETRSVLKAQGYFLIVDLSKPDSKLKRVVMATYWRVFAPLLAIAAAGRLGLKFAALSRTYNRLPRSSDFKRLVESLGFDVAESKDYMSGGVSTLLLRKKA